MILFFRILSIKSEYGTGQRKKEAKHAAAKAVLDKLIANSTVMKNGSCGSVTGDFVEA